MVKFSSLSKNKKLSSVRGEKPTIIGGLFLDYDGIFFGILNNNQPFLYLTRNEEYISLRNLTPSHYQIRFPKYDMML